MNSLSINWLAVLAAALSTFLVGGLWYSPVVFGGIWARANGLTEAQLRHGQMRAFVGAFVLAVVMSANLAFFLADSKTTVAWGMTAGALAGAGWAAAGLTIVALFERRSAIYILVNGGYLIVSFVLMGAILGGWR